MFYKFLLSNKTLIENSAIKNCHVPGLHSFLLNKVPKVRLYIADENCILRNKFDIKNPNLIIHQHKYDSIFIPLTKVMITHHLYKIPEKIDNSVFILPAIPYQRLSDKNESDEIYLHQNLKYIGSRKKLFLKGNILHSVSIEGNEKCAWLIIECNENDNFQQIGYGNFLEYENCYKKFDDPYEYLLNFFNKKRG